MSTEPAGTTGAGLARLDHLEFGRRVAWRTAHGEPHATMRFIESGRLDPVQFDRLTRDAASSDNTCRKERLEGGNAVEETKETTETVVKVGEGPTLPPPTPDGTGVLAAATEAGGFVAAGPRPKNAHGIGAPAKTGTENAVPKVPATRTGNDDPIQMVTEEEIREERRAEQILDGFETGTDVVIGALTAVTLGAHVPGGGKAGRFGFLKWKTGSKSCDRLDLYRTGTKMLREAKRQVVVVSTIPNEDFSGDPSNDDKNQDLREYRLALHSIARGNRSGPRQMLAIYRFCDLSDEDKCREAFSLIHYGRAVEIRHATIPVEFLIADSDKLLVGFPTRGSHLFGGWYQRDRNKAAIMVEWIKSWESQRCRTPSELVAVLDTAGASHSDECLCKAAPFLKDGNPVLECERQFNRMAGWYERLYRRVLGASYYQPLARFLQGSLQRTDITWLDCGCGHGFGSDQLGEQGVEYWGLDVSTELLRQGRPPASGGRARFIRADFVSSLMGVDPRAIPGCRVDKRAVIGGDLRAREKMPVLFDVISCQGNTLDFLLGRVEKTLALYLFRKHLRPGGFLVISGSTFVDEEGRPVQNLPRFLPGPPDLNLEYRFKWSGSYSQMRVFDQDHDKEIGRVVIHPVSESWAEEMLQNLGFSRVREAELQRHGLNGWFAPAGGSPYYLWVFKFDRGS